MPKTLQYRSRILGETMSMTVIERAVEESENDYLKRALKCCRSIYRKMRDYDSPHYSHCSFYAAEALAATEHQFCDLGTFGVEGYCDDVGNNGISYLNTGDSHDQTIVFDCASERFSLRCTADD